MISAQHTAPASDNSLMSKIQFSSLEHQDLTPYPSLLKSAQKVDRVSAHGGTPLSDFVLALKPSVQQAIRELFGSIDGVSLDEAYQALKANPDYANLAAEVETIGLNSSVFNRLDEIEFKSLPKAHQSLVSTLLELKALRAEIEEKDAFLEEEEKDSQSSWLTKMWPGQWLNSDWIADEDWTFFRQAHYVHTLFGAFFTLISFAAWEVIAGAVITKFGFWGVEQLTRHSNKKTFIKNLNADRAKLARLEAEALKADFELGAGA